MDRVVITPVVSGPEAPAKVAPQTTPQEKPQETPQAKPAERPAHVPEKFWKNGQIDTEAWSKSYGELEKKQSAEVKPDLSVKPKEGESPQEKKPDEGAPSVEAPIPGLTADQTTKFQSELVDGGALSEASYAELAKAGYSKFAVDTYIRGIQADQANAATQVASMKQLAGGEEGYSAMSDWMATNLSPAELQDYNDAVSSSKPSLVKMAVQGMHTKYTEAMGGKAPNLLSGKGNNPATGDVFRSQSEVSAAMRDKRYRTDDAYRKDVADKLARSKW